MLLEVAYLWTGTADRPWKSALGEGYPVRKMRLRCGVDWGLLWQAARDRHSLYVVGDWAHLATIAIVLVRLFRGFPVALRVDTPQEQLPRRQPKKWLRTTFLRWLLPRVSAIFATSAPAFRALLSMGARAEQLIDFPFYVPLEPRVDGAGDESDTRRNALRAKVGCESTGLVFVMIGTMIPKKGMDIGLRAFAQAKHQGEQPMGLLIAGDGPQRKELEALARLLRVESSVHVLGWLEPDDLESAILASDAVIHAARFDPFPVAVLDAMRLGRAVIGADVCGSVEARIRSGENGMVFPAGDTDRLAEILQSISKTPPVLRSWGEAARRTAEQWPVSRGIDTVYAALERLIPDDDAVNNTSSPDVGR